MMKYWKTWISLGFLRLAAYLPCRWQFAIGRGIGIIAYYALKRRRHITLTNIKLCFPNLSPTEHEQMTKDCFKSMGVGIMESVMSWWLPERRLKQFKLNIQGEQYYREAMKQGKGVILLGAHFPCLELAGRLVTKHLKYAVIYRTQKNQVIDKLLLKAREKNYQQVIERSQAKELIKCLKANIPLWLAADQDYGPKRSLFTPFFGIDTAFITSPIKLARQTGAVILPTFFHRGDKHNEYNINFRPPISIENNNMEEQIKAISQVIEHEVRLYPTQYYWVHRRFKTRPEGQQGVY